MEHPHYNVNIFIYDNHPLRLVESKPSHGVHDSYELIKVKEVLKKTSFLNFLQFLTTCACAEQRRNRPWFHEGCQHQYKIELPV